MSATAGLHRSVISVGHVYSDPCGLTLLLKMSNVVFQWVVTSTRLQGLYPEIYADCLLSGVLKG